MIQAIDMMISYKIWEKFHNNPWHVDCNPNPQEERVDIEEEEELNVQWHSRMQEWEIISGLYKNKYINLNEFDMLGYRDRDVIENWNSNFVDNDTSNRAMNFISQNRQLNPICS